MKRFFRNTVRPVIQKAGFDIVRYPRVAAVEKYPADFSAESIEICEKVKCYTMTSPERVDSLIHAVRYVVENGVEGAFVECGVWKGGSTMAMIFALQRMRAESRQIFMYDTYSGMSAPGDVDRSVWGEVAHTTFANSKISEDVSAWCLSPKEEVTQNVCGTGYDPEYLHFIEGRVEETIPGTLPNKIALLRLDTDWYESTRHELIHLFPLLEPSGVLIVDDYGHWEGARKAVDEYFAENDIKILLHRIDYTGRIGLKIA